MHAFVLIARYWAVCAGFGSRFVTGCYVVVFAVFILRFLLGVGVDSFVELCVLGYWTFI